MVVKENFEVQDPVRIIDEFNARNSNVTRVSSRKGALIFLVSIVGVLALAGVAAQENAAAQYPPFTVKPVQDEGYPLNLVSNRHASLHHKRHIHKETIVEEPAKPKIASQTAHNRVQATKNEEDLDVCQTPECLASATNLIGSIDETADPCTDFFQFACGKWYNNHPVTNESLGTFYEADDLVQESLKTILEADSAPGDAKPLHQMRTHYATCLDTDTMDSVGIAPLWSQLSGQSGWPMVMDTWDEQPFVFEEALAYIHKIGVSPFVGVGMGADFRNTSYKILYFSEGGLGLTGKYLLDPETYAAEIGFYKEYIVESAKLVRDSIKSGVEDAAIVAEVNDLVDFEEALASAMNFIPRNKTDVIAKTDIAGIQAYTDMKTPGQIDWLAYFRALFGATDIVINEDEPVYMYLEKYLTRLSTLFSTTPSRTIANYLGWWWTKTTGTATTYAMKDVSSNYQQNMNGKSSVPSSSSERSQHCVSQTNNNLGFPLSRAYVDQYFSPEARAETFELVELMRDAFQSLMDENTWMQPEDLVVAKEKLDAIVDYVAYPDWIMNNALLTLAYQGLEILPGEQYDNLMRMAEYYEFWNLETFRDEATKVFIMPPTVVNAFYSPFANSITILAGILQSPFYVHNSLAALNYGGIGTVIGHEFTHGFDDSGRRFDKDGNFVNWWSQETIDAFNERANCFIEQYDAYSPPELQGTENSNMTVDGKQTLGENIADNGGIREAFRAYTAYVEKYGEESRLPGLTEYTPDQLFFLGFANVWCDHKTTDDLVRQLETDPHSPGRFRVIGTLSNDADFTNAFNCPVGAPMNNGDDRCLLW